MRARISDVARVAGVSIKTVSRVLNNERYVRPDTRRRVEEAVSALNFRPNHAARSLAGRRSYQIALICDNPSPYYVYAVQDGARRRCAEAGVRLIAQPYAADTADLAEEIAALVDQAAPDGIILTPPVSDDAAVLALLTERGVPFVRVSPGTQVGLSPAVFIDNRAAAYAMTEALLSRGHRRIGFVSGHPRYAASAQRLTGYLDAIGDGGGAADLGLIKEGRFDFASGAAAADALLDLADPPTAIFASSDDMAAGVLAAAHRRGVAVPARLSVAGFDDTDLARSVWPPLSTVRQPVGVLGWVAADLLFAAAPEPEQREIAFELVMRESIAAPG